MGSARRDRASQIPPAAARHRAGTAGDRMSGRCRPAATLPTADGRVQMYPCYAFEAHVVYAEVDRDHRPASSSGNMSCGHDCGVMINPDIVHGMTYGGIAHGIGAALYEQFAYDDNGQLVSGTLHGLPDPVLARSAGHHDRRSLHAVAADRPSGRRARARRAISAHRPRSPAPSTTRLAPLGLHTATLPMSMASLGELLATGADPDDEKHLRG